MGACAVEDAPQGRGRPVLSTEDFTTEGTGVHREVRAESQQ
jgi:hypothetical protein